MSTTATIAVQSEEFHEDILTTERPYKGKTMSEDNQDDVSGGNATIPRINATLFETR